MTANAIVCTITAALWAGILTLAASWVIRRVYTWHRDHGRAPAPKEAPRRGSTTRRWAVRLPLVSRLVDREPPHEGATEDFGAELRALADLPPAPELVSDVETDLRWAQIWHDFEHDLRVQIDQVFAPYLSALTGPLDAKTCMRLDAVMAATGEFERAELDELLAVTG